MKRKTSDIPTRIWSFHAEAPILNRDLVRETLFAANRLHNNLVEIEHKHRERYGKIRSEASEGVASAERELGAVNEGCERVVEEIKNWRAEQFRETGKKTRKTPPDLREELAKLKAERKAKHAVLKNERELFKATVQAPTEELKRRRKERGDGKGPRIRERINRETFEEMMHEDWPQVWKDLQRAEMDKLAATKQAYGTSGILDGTYNQVIKAVQGATERARPGLPSFKRFEGGGRLAVQLKSIPFRDVVAGKSNHLRLRHEAWRRPGKNGEKRSYKGKRSKELWIASIRVDSEGRKPVWADFPVRLHRMPPDDAILKWAWVHVRRQGTRLRYQLQLTMESAEFSKPKRPTGVGDVSLQYCSQITESGDYRVATFGEGESIMLPRVVYEKLRLNKSLISIADQHYDAARDIIADHAIEEVSGWYERHREEPRRNKLAWRRRDLWTCVREWCEREIGADHLRQTWVDWKSDRFGSLLGKLDLFAPLEETRAWATARGLSEVQALAFWSYTWVRKDKHLRQYASDVRVRAENARKSIYRRESIRLATRFATLVETQQSLTDEKRTPRVEKESDEMRALRLVRQHVAPGELRVIVRETFGRSRTVEVST